MSGSPEDLEIGRLEAEVEHLRQRAERAERILAALREPSDEALVATVQAVGSVKLFSVKNIIRAAVTAAEQEVGRE